MIQHNLLVNIKLEEHLIEEQKLASAFCDTRELFFSEHRYSSDVPLNIIRPICQLNSSITNPCSQLTNL